MDANEKQSSGNNGSDIVLAVLTSVEQNHLITQRSLASELNIALGLANAYLKRCIHKGLIKIKSVPPRRYAYYLTADGFIEKSRLTGEYLQASFGFFRAARKQCEEVLADCNRRGWKRVVLFGLSELAEVAQLCASECGIEVIGIVDPHGGTLGNLRAATSFDQMQPWDALLLTALKDPQATYDRLVTQVAADRIVTPRMLRVSRTPRASADESERAEQRRP